ncbi:hypothetical protein IAD21_01629 [Abditibacteriota bacterium]|nr:hypothetical protein IAD21_01629 [Abditibacteriota bacterium]
MNCEQALMQWGLVPALSSLGDIRRELAAEIERRHNDIYTEDLLLLLCVQLFAARQVEDSLHIWQAKQCDFDAFCYIDGEFLCGAGLEPTRQFLLGCEAPEALAALEYIDDKDWSHFTPDEHLAQYRQYFSN